ncbi:pilus assembly protein TadG-related protein [Myceligenerans indicum]|uniref:Flp pilus-assembly TadG-like N-terminal domain-containing protein n=1 Tax=Myceligenerans indicum TaxID=2593663 RepID=A0ABS1LGW2_9MICO|nr:pilus assembly protein TadG-related protein [Myceligenerans indicum]MBL0885466.1 hypothetical protein [Myceligenerans indicum]
MRLGHRRRVRTVAARERHDRERGSLHVLTIPAALAFVTGAVLVITMIGSATDDRRETGTAADAAALAAAQEWDDHLGVLSGLHLGAPDAAEFWGILDAPPLTAGVREEMYQAAQEYAERNGAELTALRVDAARLRVTAEVRHEDEVPVAEVRSEASATARIRLSGGLCVSDDGLGWRIDGDCVTGPEGLPGLADLLDELADDPPPGDGDGEDEDEDDGDTEEDDWTPPEVSAFRSAVVLSD